MSYPPHGPPPPPYYGPPPPWPPGPPPPHPHMYPPPPDHGWPPAQYPQPYYVPGTMMVPVPVAPVAPVPHAPPVATQPTEPQATYITNYIYHGENQGPTPPVQTMPALTDQVQIAENSEYDWVPSTATTANQLTGRAVVGGYEGWDGSPLWVIRAWHAGDLIPGKLSIRHNSATVVHDGKEIPVQNIEVLCSQPESLRWVPASSGTVPPGAVPGGRTAAGETLYVGRARYQLSVTPGKVHPSHNSCYIGFGGNEVSHKMYDVLCRLS